MISITKSRPLTAADKAEQRAREFQEREREKKQQASAAKAAGMKQRKIRGDDGSVVDVWVYPSSLAALDLAGEQLHAADRFQSDWNAAYAGLRAAGMEFKVDGGKMAHERHHARVDAQARLQAAKRAIGTRSFELVAAFVIFGASARQLNTSGAHRHDVITSQFKLALDHLHSHYVGQSRKDSLWQEVEKFNQQRADMIARAEREVG